MSYDAIVAELKNVRKHPNADRLQLAYVNGFNIIVGLDAKDGDVVVLFPPDGQLDEEYAEANDLVAYTDPITHERKGGYFAKNRRVRSQKLRGEKSECYVADLSSFEYTGFDVNLLKVGDTFSELNGHKICNKYYTPATIAQMNKKQVVRRLNKCFPKHFETEKLQYVVDRIPEGSIIYTTEKLHGTSARYAFVRDEVEQPRKWYQKLLRRKPKVTNDYDFLIGTRNMILGKSDTPSFYGDEAFRYRVGEKMKGTLHKGEIIYGEIVGYTDTSPIMGEHDTSSLKDIKKAYGPKMVYSYGNVPGNCSFYVYRIARVNDDGFYVDLPWPQVKARCRELGLNIVPELDEPFILDGYKDLLKISENLMNGSSTLDPSHIREGIVFRIERPDGGIDYVKSKSFAFGVLEGYIKEKDDYVDAEEIS